MKAKEPKYGRRHAKFNGDAHTHTTTLYDMKGERTVEECRARGTAGFFWTIEARAQATHPLHIGPQASRFEALHSYI